MESGDLCPGIRTAVNPIVVGSVQGSEKALYDVLKTEGAVTGEPLPFAATAQILTVRSFRVHMACSRWTHTACLLTALKQEISSQHHVSYIEQHQGAQLT